MLIKMQLLALRYLSEGYRPVTPDFLGCALHSLLLMLLHIGLKLLDPSFRPPPDAAANWPQAVGPFIQAFSLTA